MDQEPENEPDQDDCADNGSAAPLHVAEHEEFRHENDQKEQQRKPHQRGLLKILPEGLEELFDKIPVLPVFHLKEAVVHRRGGSTDRNDRNTAHKKQQIQDQQIRNLAQKPHQRVVQIKQTSQHNVPSRNCSTSA